VRVGMSRGLFVGGCNVWAPVVVPGQLEGGGSCCSGGAGARTELAGTKTELVGAMTELDKRTLIGSISMIH
jgi:hypothetical protein